MEALDFASFFERLQKSMNISIDSEIVCLIYSYYNRPYYEYTTFQLLNILDDHHIHIYSNINRNALIKIIESNNIVVPHRQTKIDTKWNADAFRHPGIYIEDVVMKITTDDFVKISKKNLQIASIFKKRGESGSIYRVMLKNLKTHKYIKMNVIDFINMLDDENVTFKYNEFRHIWSQIKTECNR